MLEYPVLIDKRGFFDVTSLVIGSYAIFDKYTKSRSFSRTGYIVYRFSSG